MFKVLSFSEERELEKDEIRNYYANLKEFVLKRKLTNTTPGALTVAPKLKGITNKIATKVTSFLCKSDVEIIVDGIENIPEGTWNLSPNKLHLPISFGFLDIARKAAAAVVPMVMEYTYDSTQAVECIKKIHVRFGKAMYVNVYDDLKQKLSEYEEVISTMRLELMEEKVLFSRKAISNQEYINFLKGNFHNLQLGGINLDSERFARDYWDKFIGERRAEWKDYAMKESSNQWNIPRDKWEYWQMQSDLKTDKMQLLSVPDIT